MLEPIQYIIYDLSIENLEERKAGAQVFSSGRKLSDAIGIKPNRIPDYLDPAKQKRFHSVKLQKDFAIRVAKKEQHVTEPEKASLRTTTRKMGISRRKPKP